MEVVAPVGISERRIHHFVELKQQWVLDTLRRLEEKTRQLRSFAPGFYREGADIPYQGRSYRLVLRATHLKRIKIEFSDQFIVHVPETLFKQEHNDEIRSALMRWYKNRAKLEVEHFVQKHAGQYQLLPRSIKIKTQKSRWGSCGVHNDIHINWLLILAPPPVLEYVIVHELCHIKIRNHSVHFWNLVAAHLPDYQRHRHWLKEHGGSLMMGI